MVIALALAACGPSMHGGGGNGGDGTGRDLALHCERPAAVTSASIVELRHQGERIEIVYGERSENDVTLSVLRAVGVRS